VKNNFATAEEAWALNGLEEPLEKKKAVSVSAYVRYNGVKGYLWKYT
jgi:hypothetical protein